jgi:hypothetical protein
MTSNDVKISTFVSWVHKNLAGLRHQPSAVVADQLGEAILRIDGQLGVEVADDESDVREVIVTAFSEPKLFSLVRQITKLLSDVPGWRFVALKPPRGFAFKLSAGPHRIDASSLEFAPIQDIKAGIQLVVPPPVLEALSEQEAEELAWLVVETGVGEELAGLLRHVELSSAQAADQHPIEELGTHIRANLRNS